MCDCNRRGFVWRAASLGVAGVLTPGVLMAAQTAQPPGKPKVYTCPPCGCPNDGKDLPGPGDCPVCAMPLMEKPPAKPEAAAPKPPEPKPAPPERPAPK